MHNEQEIKIEIKDISSFLMKVRKIAKYKKTEYIRDVIYGSEEEKKKIRLRIVDNFEYQSIDTTHKYKVDIEEGVRKEIEEIIYKGSSVKDAISSIKSRGDFKEENSYEKTRILFIDDTDTEITVDIYPFGVWCEIEGQICNIHDVVKKLGYSKDDYCIEGADDLYLTWNKNKNLKEMWDVRFGLTGSK